MAQRPAMQSNPLWRPIRFWRPIRWYEGPKGEGGCISCELCGGRIPYERVVRVSEPPKAPSPNQKPIDPTRAAKHVKFKKERTAVNERWTNLLSFGRRLFPRSQLPRSV